MATSSRDEETKSYVGDKKTAEEFLAAARDGDVGQMEGMLAADPGLVRATDSDGVTAVHWAAYRGHTAVVRWLLAAAPELLHAETKSGWQPAHLAAWWGHEDVLAVLIERGARVNAQTEAGRTPLHEAAECGSEASVRVLLAADPGLARATDSLGWTAVHAAAYCGHTAVVRRLLAAAPELLHAKTKLGSQPAHHAARGGHADVLAVLIERGARVDAQDGAGWTLLHRAAECGSEECVRVLLAADPSLARATNRAGWTAVHRAARRGRTAVVRRLLAAAPELIHAETKRGLQPAHLAAGRGHTDVLVVLMERGARVDAQDEDGRTPLHRAARCDREACVRVLLAAGARVDVRNNNGDTARDLAYSSNIVALLEAHEKSTRNHKPAETVPAAGDMNIHHDANSATTSARGNQNGVQILTTKVHFAADENSTINSHKDTYDNMQAVDLSPSANAANSLMDVATNSSNYINSGKNNFVHADSTNADQSELQRRNPPLDSRIYMQDSYSSMLFPSQNSQPPRGQPHPEFGRTLENNPSQINQFPPITTQPYINTPVIQQRENTATHLSYGMTFSDLSSSIVGIAPYKVEMGTSDCMVYVPEGAAPDPKEQAPLKGKSTCGMQTKSAKKRPAQSAEWQPSNRARAPQGEKRAKHQRKRQRIPSAKNTNTSPTEEMDARSLSTTSPVDALSTLHLEDIRLSFQAEGSALPDQLQTAPPAASLNTSEIPNCTRIPINKPNAADESDPERSVLAPDASSAMQEEEFTIIKGASERGMDMLAELSGYKYVKDGKPNKKGKQRWRCSVRRCLASVMQNGASFERRNHPHKCESTNSLVPILKVKADLRREGKANLGTSAKNIVEDVINKHDQLRDLPSKDSLIRATNRLRQIKPPQQPKD